MQRKKHTANKAENAREDRLKAALKANLGRRKAQARARADKPPQEDNGQNGNKD